MKILSAKVIVCSPGRNFVTLKIETDQGIYGLGDATLNGRELAVASYLEDHLIPCLIGRDPFQTEDIWHYFYRGAYWRRGPVTMTAIAAIDMALWDIKGKALGVPVYNLLGGKSRTGVMVYAHATGRDIGKVERRGAAATHAGGFHHHGFQHPHVGVDVARVGAVGEAGGDERAVERALLGDAHAVVVEVRAAAVRGGKELLTQGIVDDGVLELALVLAGDGDAEDRVSMHEVRRAIERIDDPERIVLAACAAFLGENGMIGIRLVDDGDDLPFGGVIDFSDEVIAALRGDLQAVEARHAANDDFARAACRTYGDVEKWLHAP